MTSQPTPSETMEKLIHKDRKHDHSWIEDGSLCESYNTLRGLRWRWKAYTGIIPDYDIISDEELTLFGFTIKSHD